MKKIRFTLSVLFLLCLGISAIAQTKIPIQGTVFDKNNEPVIGATIVEKGTTNGTVTDIDGKFKLNVSNANATIRISFTGYDALELPASNSAAFGKVMLHESAVMLNEVVAIGYGTVKKNDATGSVNAFKPDQLTKGVTTNAQDMIVGKIAGVTVTPADGTPGGRATIRIRGGSSLNASNDPLIVIDGLPMDNEAIKGVANPLSTINPNDIETFTVLKDASATAIYGSRASNGVIIITTKRGKNGAKPTVSYSGNVSIGQVRKTFDVMDGDQYRALINATYAPTSDAVKHLGTANTDWQKEIYQNALGTDHNLSVSGGLKNMPYRVSAGYTNQNGIVKTSNFERYTGSVSLSPSLMDDHLKFNLNAKVMSVKNRYADGGAIGSAVSMDPTQPVKTTDPNDIYNQHFGGYYQWYNVKDDGSFNNYNSLAPRNPVATLMLRDERANSTDFIGNAEADYKFHFFPDLKAHLGVAIQSSTGKQGLMIQKTAAGDDPWGRTGFETIDKTNKTLNAYLQYAKEVGKNRFDIMGGYEWQHFYKSGSNEYRGLDKEWKNPSGQLDYYNYTSKVFKSESYLVSFFGRMNYTYNDKYLVTVTVRSDGSSMFINNKWGVFPSAALAWKINNEDFLKDNSSISDLKLRLGYGVTGQQDIGLGAYPSMPTYTSNIAGAFYPILADGEYTWRPNGYNPNLKWEQTATTNIGLDFGFANSRFTGSIDLYNRDTKDLLSFIAVPAGTNLSNQVWSNVGTLNNKGIEFSLNTKVIKTKDFMWELNYNVSYNKNEITKLNNTSDSYKILLGGISSGTGNNVQAHAVGQTASSFYVYQQVYDSNGKPVEGVFVDRNKDGIVSDADRYFFHKPAADVLMGLTSKITYKNFDFSFALRSSLGNYVYNDAIASRHNVSESGLWSTSGFLTNKPIIALESNFSNATNNYLSDFYVQNASFLRMDNITAGYSFKRGRVFATVQNPFVWTKYKGLDPEVFSGIDGNIYPRPITTMVGVNFNF